MEEERKTKEENLCPKCGYCKACGRGGMMPYYTFPIYPVYPSGFWYYDVGPYNARGGFTTSGFISGTLG